MKVLSRSEIISLLNQKDSGFVIRTFGPDFFVNGVSTDSRAIAKGSLFIPLVGERFDGHDFIETAFDSGACAALTHREYNDDKPVIKVRDTMLALQNLAGAYRRLFSPIMVAVTGSAGKTTTKEMTAAVISSKFRTLKTKGNLNNEIGLPLTLLELDASHGAAVVEMGMSGFGEISGLSKLALPDIAIITNIGQSHIEYLGSREGIRKAKLEILDGMKKNGYIVLNGDDEYLKTCPEAKNHKVLYFAIDNQKADVRACNIESGNSGSRFVISYPGGQVEAESVIPGMHSIYNALAAFTAGICAGVPPESAARAIKTVLPEGMRQRIYKSGNITIIKDCYNANPDSVKAALAVLNGYKERKIALLGDMLELGNYSCAAHREIGRQAAHSANIIIAIGQYSSDIAFGALEAGADKAGIFTPSRDEVPRLLKSVLTYGDVLLVKGSRAMRMEELIDKYKEI